MNNRKKIYKVFVAECPACGSLYICVFILDSHNQPYDVYSDSILRGAKLVCIGDFIDFSYNTYKENEQCYQHPPIETRTFMFLSDLAEIDKEDLPADAWRKI